MQRSHRLLIASQEDESMSLTVQPGPARGVARAKPVSLCKPVEGRDWTAEIHRREADLLVGPRLTGIFGDHCFCGSDAPSSNLPCARRRAAFAFSATRWR